MDRRKRFFSFVMGLSLLVLGCAAVRAAHGAESAGPAEIEAAGPYVHQPSGMLFPETVLDFKRVEIFRYDNEGRDVSCGYNLERKDSTVVATVYVYPMPRNDNPPAAVAASHFDEVKKAIASAHADAKLLQEDGVKLTQGKVAQAGLHALFRFEQDMPAGRQTVRSEAYLFTHGRWFIKYRLTYPEANAEQSVKDIRAFMESLKWPG